MKLFKDKFKIEIGELLESITYVKLPFYSI
jgi:hypothetical protein